MSNLTRYGQSALDKTFPDADESVFGHMVLELGMSPDEAVQNLRPWVRDLDRSAELSKKTAYIAAFIGAGAGLATAATMGIGLTTILPIAAAAYNFFSGQKSAREQGVRESEYLLLKTCPELLKLIYALTQKGMPKEALVECYDDLLGAFTMQFQQRASLGMSDELDHDIVRSFQRIVQEKCEAESLARAIVAETEGFVFDTLYQSTELKTESLPASPDTTLPAATDSGSVATSSPIGAATKFGSIEVPASPAADSSHETTALSALLRSPFLSRALFGAQRTGKSYLAAVASAEMAKTGVNIFHINLMSYGSEDATYWQHATTSIRCDLPALSVSDGKPFIKQAIALVAEFVQTPNSLLIVDEWAYIASTANPHRESLVGLLNDISSQITSLSSAGIKRQRGLWAISPEFVAGSLVPQGKAVKKLQLVYVTIHPDRLVDWNGNAIGFSDELFQQVANNFPIELPNSMDLPDCDRVVYIDRQWLPVGELPAVNKPPIAPQREMELSKSENEQEKQEEQDEKRVSLEKLYRETPNLPTAPAFELIQSVPNSEKREALLIAYKWATTRLEDGKDIDKQSFLARARSERNCAYLRDCREEIWGELQGLLD